MTNKEQILEEWLKELNKILRKWSSKYGVEAANDVWEFLLVDLESLLSKTQQATIGEARQIVHDSRVCCIDKCPRIHDEIIKKLDKLKKG